VRSVNVLLDQPCELMSYPGQLDVEPKFNEGAQQAFGQWDEACGIVVLRPVVCELFNDKGTLVVKKQGERIPGVWQARWARIRFDCGR